jgi:2-hydroxy-3-oxopropionate reductase
METRIGYIGVGKIGKPIAANAIAAGYPLMAFDINEKPLQDLQGLGAKAVRSSAEVGEWADIIELSVVNDEQVEEVILSENGVLEQARPGSVIAIHSTIHPSTAIKIGEIAGSKGVGVVDAPFSGGVEGALARTMLYTVGGTEELFERCRPLFETSGTTIVHMGPLGSGAMMRIVHHVILGLNRMAADEGMLLARQVGLRWEDVSAAMHGGEGQSNVTDGYLQKYRLMPTGGQSRVASMALAMANEKGTSLPALALFQQLYLNGPRVTMDE